MTITMLVAASSNDAIGQDGHLPWHLPADLAAFKNRTRGHAVILGRRTSEAIQESLGKPLPQRLSVVVTRSAPPLADDFAERLPQEGVIEVSSIEDAKTLAEAFRVKNGQQKYFVIGGEQIYCAFLAETDDIYLTRVHGTVVGDRHMPDDWLNPFDLVSEDAVADKEATHPYSFLHYRRRQ